MIFPSLRYGDSVTDTFMPSVLGWMKGIRPVKKLSGGVLAWRGYLSGARCRLAFGPADATATHCLLHQ